jgi:hypothetical protein
MKFALWFMNRFAVDSSLTGDLTEEWATGRSGWWLMWQTCVAIARAPWAGLRHHKLRTFAAVAIGWIGWNPLAYAFQFGIHAFGYPGFPVGLLLFILRPILLGWIVGRLQPAQPLGTALLYIATFIIVTLWLSRPSLGDYRFILALGSWLILTTTIGGLLATRKPKGFPILG